MNSIDPSTSAGDGAAASRPIGSVAFIGGGNMASALIGGLLRQGLRAAQIKVVEPFAEARERLATQFKVLAQASSGPFLRGADLVVWAVKPQTFREAAAQVAPYTSVSLHLSVAAGIRSDSIARWLGTQRVVRCMPNTPALIGKGITALFARPGVGAQDKLLAQRVIEPTGELLWVDDESMLDAVTALSGSGPAYVFYFIEAMVDAGVAMGLDVRQAQQLAIATFAGASTLAQTSDEPPNLLRQRVTSKGGTTFAAISSMEADGVKAQLVRAMLAARERAAEMGDEFGAAG
jgi:pyrroline-5-carboxylate reductase